MLGREKREVVRAVTLPLEHTPEPPGGLVKARNACPHRDPDSVIPGGTHAFEFQLPCQAMLLPLADPGTTF